MKRAAVAVCNNLSARGNALENLKFSVLQNFTKVWQPSSLFDNWLNLCFCQNFRTFGRKFMAIALSKLLISIVTINYFRPLVIFDRSKIQRTLLKSGLLALLRP